MKSLHEMIVCFPQGNSELDSVPASAFQRWKYIDVFEMPSRVLFFYHRRCDDGDGVVTRDSRCKLLLIVATAALTSNYSLGKNVQGVSVFSTQRSLVRDAAYH